MFTEKKTVKMEEAEVTHKKTYKIRIRSNNCQTLNLVGQK